MTLNRRDFLKAGTIGLATAWTAGCVPKNAMQVRFRGLLLVERFASRAAVHVVDSTVLTGIPNHRSLVRIYKSAIDLNQPYIPPSRKKDEGLQIESWEWDITRGMSVRFHAQEPPLDTLQYEMSRPTLPNPGEGGKWESMRLLPALKDLTAASSITNRPALALSIDLKDGHLWSDFPKSLSGPHLVWTFKNPTNSQVLLSQALSDTLLYWSPLNGEPPTIRIDSGTISLNSGKSKFVSIENFMFPPPVTNPGDPFSLGHFDAFYQLLNGTITPDVTVNPRDRPACPNCDVDPIYCPPGVF